MIEISIKDETLSSVGRYIQRLSSFMLDDPVADANLIMARRVASVARKTDKFKDRSGLLRASIRALPRNRLQYLPGPEGSLHKKVLPNAAIVVTSGVGRTGARYGYYIERGFTVHTREGPKKISGKFFLQSAYEQVSSQLGSLAIRNLRSGIRNKLSSIFGGKRDVRSLANRMPRI